MERRIAEAARAKLFHKGWRLALTIPSVLARGEEFTLRATAFAPDGLPSGGFSRAITFAESPGVEGLPRRLELGPGGTAELEGLTASGAPLSEDRDAAYVEAEVEGAPGRVRSNPAWVFDEPPWRIYWGDIHVHTVHSNCQAWACHEPEFMMAYARDAAHLDFCAAADHLRGIASDPARWPRQQELVRKWDEPGRFVPFLAFESSHKSGFGGDTNAYFLGAQAPHFWLDREDMKGNAPEVELAELWRFLDSTGERYFTVPHHTGRAGKYRSFAEPVYDEGREPLFEVFSAWGSSEARCTRFPLHGGNTDRPAYLVDALRAGCRYGVVASSDDHATMPGSDWKCNWGRPLGPKSLTGYIHHGLAAVRARALARGPLWKAFVSRRAYATTFDRTLVDFRVCDVETGSSAEVGARDPLARRREITLDVLAEGPGRGVAVLVRNGEELARESFSPERPRVEFVDGEMLERVAIRGAPFHPEPFAVYYVRIEGAAGETQWSSPVWIDLA